MKKEQLFEHFRENTLVLLVSAIVFVAIEAFWPAERHGKRVRPGTVTDLLCSYFVPVMTFPIYFVAIDELVANLPAVQRIDALRHLQGFVGRQSLGVQLAIAIVVADFVGYWRHRGMHRPKLWPFHAIHHSSRHLGWLSNERFHPVDSLSIPILQISSLLLLGLGAEAIAIHAVVRRAYSMFIHANVDLSYGALDRIVVSPRVHRWHHSTDARVADKNYATFFSLFDWMFGTLALPPNEVPRTFGVDDPALGEGFGTQLAYPFRLRTWRKPAESPMVPSTR